MRRRDMCSLLLCGATAAALAACGGDAQQDAAPQDQGEAELPVIGKAPEITLTGWINSEPITMASLQGKSAALIDFWTYT